MSSPLSSYTRVEGYNPPSQNLEVDTNQPMEIGAPNEPMQIEPSPSVQTINYAAVMANILQSETPTCVLPQEGKALLENLLSLFTQYMLITNALSPEKRQAYLAINAKKAESCAFFQNHNIDIPKDAETQMPLLFQTIQQEASLQVEKAVLFQKKQRILRFHPQIDIERLSLNEIEEIYRDCSEKVELAQNVQKKMLALIEFAALPESIKNLYSVSIECHHDPRAPFRIVTDRQNVLMGYTIHDLLSSIGIRSEEYEGEFQFGLNQDELKQLSEHLSHLISWIDDFSLIIGDLIRDDMQEVKQHLSLGQKSKIEILRNPLKMSASTVMQLQPQQEHLVCLLFNRIALNLTNHPERDFLKQKIEAIYTAENMLGSNGLPKKFLDSDPYRSNLNLEQVIKICPRLNKLLKLQQLAQEFTGKNSLKQSMDVLTSCGITNELETMQQYKIGILHEMHRAILGDRMPSTLLTKLDEQLTPITHIDVLEKESLQLCHGLLEKNTFPFFKTKATMYEPSPAEIRLLYNEQQWTTYADNQQHKNIAQLFSALKNSDHFKAILQKHPAFESVLVDFETELRRRLNGYAGLSPTGVYGRSMIDEALQYFEQYVAKIVYFNWSKVTQESIERSLMVLAATIGSDMTHGCNTGFAGRIQTVLLTLTASIGNDVEDNITEFQKECLEAAFQERTTHDSESSMTARAKGEVSQFLGLVSFSERKNYSDLTPQAKNILQHFFARYTPVAIYQRIYQFFSDKFWELNKEDHDEEMYDLFTELSGCSRAESDKKYRVNGNPANKWQYSFFQQDLPQFLIAFLLQQKFLFTKPTESSAHIFQKEGEEPHALAIPQARSHEARPLYQEEQDRNRRIGWNVNFELPQHHFSTS